MNTATSVSEPTAALAVELFKLTQAVVVQSFDDADEAMLDYLQVITENVPTGGVYFMHVVPRVDFFSLSEEEMGEDFLSLGDFAIQQERMANMKSDVASHFPNSKKMSLEYDVKEGDPLEILLEETKYVEADLLAIGKNTKRDTNGILVKNLARKAGCNVLIVPDQAKPVLKKIIVPIDFSDNSAAALRMAVSIAQRMPETPSVVALNIFDLPFYGTLRMGKKGETLNEMVINDRRDAVKTFLHTHLSPQDRELVRMATATMEHLSFGADIVKYAEDNKGDLLVMGAKGHSKVHLLLIGSVTEKVLSLTKHIPVLVVKG